MRNPEQIEAAAEVLMSEQRAAQAFAVEKERTSEQRLVAQRRAAGWGLGGMAIGALIGHVVFVHWFAAALVGLGAGMVLGRWVLGRKA